MLMVRGILWRGFVVGFGEILEMRLYICFCLLLLLLLLLLLAVEITCDAFL